MAEAAGVSAAPERPATARARVLVKERIAEGGVELLRERFDVDVEIDMPADELADRIAGYDALIVRSATAVDADLLARAERLKVVGRAGTGVDNVDVAERHPPRHHRRQRPRREHGVGRRARASDCCCRWPATSRRPTPRSAPAAGSAPVSAASRCADKTLGILGFGRIGQLVAARARGLGMQVIAHDPFVTPERFRELQVGQCSRDELWQRADFITPARAADGGDAPPGAGRDDRSACGPACAS